MGREMKENKRKQARHAVMLSVYCLLLSIDCPQSSTVCSSSFSDTVRWAYPRANKSSWPTILIRCAIRVSPRLPLPSVSVRNRISSPFTLALYCLLSAVCGLLSCAYSTVLRDWALELVSICDMNYSKYLHPLTSAFRCLLSAVCCLLSAVCRLLSAA
jgi:hypothetical protein